MKATKNIAVTFSLVPPSPNYSPTTFVELLPMVSLPSLYGMEGTIFLRIFLALAQRVAHHQI